jgi:hypothetical protein
VCCSAIFPSLQKKWNAISHHGWMDDPCPCDIFGHSYVVRKARILLARNGRLKRGNKRGKRGKEGPAAEH